MKTALLVLWLALPLAAAAYHFGPGQDLLKRDAAATHLSAARKAVKEGDHAAAIEACNAAIAALPTDAATVTRQLRLWRAQAMMPSGQLPEAHDDLVGLLSELEADSSADAGMKREARASLASAKYYLAWLMRLEGGSEEQWGPEIEAARQHFRLLAEEAENEGQTALVTTHRESLESAIRLARMDLTELQGLPLPKQCKNCQSGKCKPRPTAKKNPPQDSRGAGKTMGPDQSGS